MCVVPSPPAVAPGRGDAGEDEEEEEEEEEEEKDILRGAARAAGAGSGGGGRGRGCGAGSFSFHAEFNFNLLGIFVWGNTMYFPTYILALSGHFSGLSVPIENDLGPENRWSNDVFATPRDGSLT